jgi:hypothetical protein
MTSESLVRAAFAEQARWCRHFGSPFTGLLLDQAAAGLNRDTAIGRRILDWPGNPDATHDALPLRLAGGLHGLARSGRLPDLTRLYPPAAMPDGEMLWRAAVGALTVAHDALDKWLDSAPQTNEVARSPMLMCGLLAITAATGGLPIALHELGASGGLNLLLDRYFYRFGGSLVTGAKDATLVFTPELTGTLPPDAPVRVIRRRGVDLNPLDLRRDADRNRLLSYIWPDQLARLARIKAAIEIARIDPPPIDRGDAADWIEAMLEPGGAPGVVRVVMHSIAFQYFPARTQERILAHIEMVGARATAAAPFAWLRFELDAPRGGAALRLKLWPGGEDRMLATGSAQQPRIDWIG